MLRESAPLQQSPVALMRQNAGKSRNFAALTLLLPFARRYTRALAAGVAGVLGAGIAMLMVGQIFRHLIDQGITTQNAAGLHHALFAMLGVVVLLAGSSWLRLVLLTGTAEQVIADLRARVLKNLLSLDIAWFEAQKTGDLLSRFTADMAVLQVLLGTSLPIALRNVLIVCGGLIMMISASPILSLLIVCLMPVIVILLYILTPKLRQAGRDVQDKTGMVAAHLSESLQAMREIQAFTREMAQEAQFGRVNQRAIGASWRYVHIRALLSSLIILVVFTGITGLLWFGGNQVMTGHMSAGQLSAFVFYALLVAGSVGAISEIYSDLQRAAGAVERIGVLLDARSTLSSVSVPITLPQQGELSLAQVSFAYASRPDVKAIDDLSFQLRAGEITAVVGPSGAGKTTLFNLILRLYDPTSGVIQLGDSDIKTLDPHDYRRLFSLVPQDPTLFSMTIRDNIAFADPQASEAALLAASKAAGAHDFITALPNGYSTMLGERGARLSGGQAQRVALARALLRDPKILLLDEATAHLDSETERAIQDALLTTRKGRTTLIIAHRLSTIQHADRILVLDHGRLVADGKHETLLQTSPLYQKLATTQMKA